MSVYVIAEPVPADRPSTLPHYLILTPYNLLLPQASLASILIRQVTRLWSKRAPLLLHNTSFPRRFIKSSQNKDCVIKKCHVRKYTIPKYGSAYSAVQSGPISSNITVTVIRSQGRKGGYKVTATWSDTVWLDLSSCRITPRVNKISRHDSNKRTANISSMGLAWSLRANAYCSAMHHNT